MQFLFVLLGHFLMGAPEWGPQTRGSDKDGFRFTRSVGNCQFKYFAAQMTTQEDAWIGRAPEASGGRIERAPVSNKETERKVATEFLVGTE